MRVLTGRVVPAYVTSVSLATGVVTWVVIVSAALVPAASRYGDVVGVEFVAPADAALPRLAERSAVYAADGSVLAVLHDEENRRVVGLDSVPVHLWQAVVTAEDRRFWEHEGYAVVAVARAGTANVRAGDLGSGRHRVASTRATTSRPRPPAATPSWPAGGQRIPPTRGSPAPPRCCPPPCGSVTPTAGCPTRA